MIEQALLEKAEQHAEEGFWSAYHRLRQEGKTWITSGFIGFMWF